MTNGREARICLQPGAQVFVAGPGEPLLDAGRRAGFTFPQACRNGNCFRCEGRLLAGEVEHLRSGACTRADGGAGFEAPWVLPCIVAARGDCTLAVEGVYAPGELPVLTVSAQVVAVKDFLPGIAQAQLRLPAGKNVSRLAGQYLEILDGDDAYAFSMASPPATGRDIELHIGYGEDNPASLRVMALLRAETTVRLRLPKGDCTLAGEPRLPLLFLAGSTGFSQIKAFVEHAIAQRWQVPISIYWGTRTLADLYLRDLAENWARSHGHIRFVPVLSAENQPGLRHGHVHEAVLADRPDFTQLQVYAAGSPGMVHAAFRDFVAAGLPRERFFSDVFAWSPPDGVNDAS